MWPTRLELILVASWLVHLTPEQEVRVRDLAIDIVPLSTQVYKWVPANCWGNLTNCGGVTCNGLASRPGEVKILLAASCYRLGKAPAAMSQSWLQGFTSHPHPWEI